MAETQTRLSIGVPDSGTARALSLAPCLVLISCVALSSTTGVGIGRSWFDEQRILCSLALMLACGATLLSKASIHAVRPGIALLLGVSFGLISSMLALRTYVAMVDWAVYCLIGVIAVYSKIDRNDIRLMAAATVITVATAYVAGFASNYVSSVMLGFPVGAETLLVGFSNPRFPAQMQALTIPLIPVALKALPKGFWRTAFSAVAILWWACLIGSGSRTAWIALAAVSVIVFSTGSLGRSWFCSQLRFALIGFAAWTLLFLILPQFWQVPASLEGGRFSNFSSVSSRWTLWSLSWQAIAANPFFGIGPAHLAYSYNGEGAHPHNFWLQLAAEWGLPAMAIAGFAAVAVFVRLFDRARQPSLPKEGETSVCLLAAVSVWGLGTLADGYMVTPTSQVISAVIAALSVSWLRSFQSVGPRPRSARKVDLGLRVLAATAIVALISLPFTPYGRADERELQWRVENPNGFFWPRFWQQGWIGPDQDSTAR